MRYICSFRATPYQYRAAVFFALFALLTGVTHRGFATEVFDQAKFDSMVQRGLNYLREHGQAEDGTFSIEAGSGIT
jgi:hypothetical protein